MKNYSNDEIKMESNSRSNESKECINILIIETNSEIKALYKRFFNTVAPSASYTLVDDIRKTSIDCSSAAGVPLNLIKQFPFDTVIIDINAGNYDRIEIAEEIFKRLPQQRLIITTASDLPTIRQILQSHALSYSIPILQKPFKLSELLYYKFFKR